MDVGERAAAYGLPGDDAQPGLDLIDPGRADKGEMKADVGILREPFLHVRCAVGGEVVQYDMNLLARMRLDRLLEEGEKIVSAVLRLAPAMTSPVWT